MNNYIERIRSRFPFLNVPGGGKPVVYFDSAATSQKPENVVEFVRSHMTEANANVHRAVYGLAEKSTGYYEAGREAARRLIGAEDRSEVVLTSGTTASINLLAMSLGGMLLKEGDEILLSEGEHHSNIVPWQMLASAKGAKLRYFPVNPDGSWNLDEAERILSAGKVKIVSAAHISNVLGIVNPVSRLTESAHRYGALVHLDGAQGIVHRKVDVKELDCDFYSFSGHKLYALTGTGILYGRKELMERMPPVFGGGEMVDTVGFETTTYAKSPLKFEAGTPNFIAAASLSPAIEFVDSVRTEQVFDNERTMLDYLMRELNEIDGLRIYGTAAPKIPLISFTVEGAHHSDIATLLGKMGYALRSGLLCSEPLIGKFGRTGVVRISLAPYNTLEECESFVQALHKVLRMLK